MKIYVAARFGRIRDARSVGFNLMSMGHEVTSTWLKQTGDAQVDTSPDVQSDALAYVGRRDLREILASDAMIQLTEDPREKVPGAERGGRHTELGMALGRNIPVVLLGTCRETVFHHLCDTVETPMEAVQRLEELLDEGRS